MNWENILGVVTSIVPVLDAKRAREVEHVERTLEALSSAYYATQSYFASIKDGERPSRREQIALAEKWDHAGHLIRRYDENLASRLSLKSRFWREGGAWDKSQIAHANIGLENVRRDGRAMLLIKQHKN